MLIHKNFVVVKMCLPILIHRWLGNSIKHHCKETRILQLLKHGKYYWRRLQTKDFEIKYLGKCQDLYVQNNTLLPADVLNQPASIGLQDVPRTSPSNVPRTSPKDTVWPSRGRSDQTSWGRLIRGWFRTSPGRSQDVP